MGVVLINALQNFNNLIAHTWMLSQLYNYICLSRSVLYNKQYRLTSPLSHNLGVVFTIHCPGNAWLWYFNFCFAEALLVLFFLILKHCIKGGNSRD